MDRHYLRKIKIAIEYLLDELTRTDGEINTLLVTKPSVLVYIKTAIDQAHCSIGVFGWIMLGFLAPVVWAIFQVTQLISDGVSIGRILDTVKDTIFFGSIWGLIGWICQWKITWVLGFIPLGTFPLLGTFLLIALVAISMLGVLKFIQ